MPEGTKVDRVYKALRREGKSEEDAAKIAQSQTGEALATGKPPKHENIHFQNGRTRALAAIENRMKFGNVNIELVKALEKADAFGYADKYKRGLMTEEEVKKFLKIGERIKPTEKELTWTKDRSPKIFGYSYDEIARKQGIPYLR